MTKDLRVLLSRGYRHRMLRNSVQVITPGLMKDSEDRLPGGFGAMVLIHLGSVRNDRPGAPQPLQGHINVDMFMSPHWRDDAHSSKGLLKGEHAAPVSLCREIFPLMLGL